MGSIVGGGCVGMGGGGGGGCCCCWPPPAFEPAPNRLNKVEVIICFFPKGEVTLIPESGGLSARGGNPPEWDCRMFSRASLVISA
jgi:hypothetical protein